MFADDFNVNVNQEELETFFTNNVISEKLRICDVTNVYYISRKLLSPALEKCTNLKVLRVANSNLTCQMVGRILARCTQLVELSLSAGVKKFWLRNLHIPEELEQVLSQSVGCPWEGMLNHTYFKDSRETLRKLQKLEFHAPPDPTILGVILR